MSVVLTEKIVGPAAWIGRKLVDDKSWCLRLSPGALACLDRALTEIKQAGKSFPNFSREHFRIPALLEDLNHYADQLENGPGFLLLRGLPVERYSEQEIRIIYYGIGLNLGVPVRQNPNGDLLGTVMNTGDPDCRSTRVYETNAYLPYHTDPSDVVGLLCLRKARTGGLSSLVSAATVYNRILSEHPSFLALFYRPLYYAHLGDKLPGRSPIFSYHEDKLSCRYLRQYIELGHEEMNTPVSRVETEALDIFDSITHDPDLRLDMMLEPGDLQFVNNYAVLHSRTAFEDDKDRATQRKMLRLWLQMPNARSLAPDFPGRNGFGVPPL